MNEYFCMDLALSCFYRGCVALKGPKVSYGADASRLRLIVLAASVRNQ
jgi:hypothetical protein